MVTVQVETAHRRIHNTALAAAVATLGVPLDPAEPANRIIDTETGVEQVVFIFRDKSDTDPTRETAKIVQAWDQRAAFETANPRHPLVSMRAAHDARAAIVKIIHGAHLPPVAGFQGEKFQTPHLSEACILKAHGFPLLLLTGRAFSFPNVWKGIAAKQVIAESQREHGQSSAQWQARFLVNLNRFLAAAKGTPVLATREEDRTLLLSADASKKTRDRWLDML